MSRWLSLSLAVYLLSTQLARGADGVFDTNYFESPSPDFQSMLVDWLSDEGISGQWTDTGSSPFGLQRRIAEIEAFGNSIDLIHASLLAAGHSHDKATELASMFQLQVQSLVQLTGGPEGTGPEAIFREMQQRYLKGAYDENLFDVGETIRTSRFNCLTGTILFRAVCEHAGIPAAVLSRPAHVCCWLQRHGLVVETTAEDWLRAATYEDQPRGRLLTTANLLGKVFYNRGIALMQAGEYSTALASTWIGYVLDPHDASAHRNVRACINNWALHLAEKREFALALRLLEEGLRLDPSYAPFRRNRHFVLEATKALQMANIEE